MVYLIIESDIDNIMTSGTKTNMIGEGGGGRVNETRSTLRLGLSL